MEIWSNLKKDDNLYLLIPIINNDKKLVYKYQESKVINIKEYKSIYRLTFKYTNMGGKRVKTNLAINKNKCNLQYLAVSDATEWARGYEVKYGDMIITTIDDKLYLCSLVDMLINNDINKYKDLIKIYTDVISGLEMIKKTNNIYE